jgi:type I restriction enzyme, S subunit
MSKYKAYAEYKDSDVKWLGQVPLTWKVISIKRVSKIVNGATPKSAEELFWDGDISWVTPADLGKSSSPFISEGARRISLAGYQSCGTSLVPQGTVILSSRAPIGTLGIASKELCTNQGCKSLVVTNHLNSKYLYYVLFSSTEQLNLLGRGTTFLELSADELGSYKIGVPSISDQETIANFLDHETAKIDTLIEKQQQLIKLLKEKRQAVISHAVTKGLNPNASLRDSGVDWLGEVPKHWITMPLKLIVKTRKGAPFKADDFCDQGIRVVKASDIKQLTIRSSDVFLPRECVTGHSRALLKAGDIILSTVGSNPDVRNSAVGQVGMVPVELDGSLLNQNTVIYDPDEKKILREYLFYILQMDGYRDHLDINAHGTANQSSLNIADMLNFNICLPPRTEQIEISNYLKVQQEKLTQLELRARESEMLLQERRTALISAAVTGKIDVRDWQSQSQTTNQKIAA